jgi:hypothetical protein
MDEKYRVIGHIEGYQPTRYGRRADPASLESPLNYYQITLGISIGRKSDWAHVKCPFHDDRHASLGINIRHGGFVCHACGAKGGNIVAFEAQLKGIGYREALLSLGGR